MNTDKLMELVDELRESITDYGGHGESIRNEVMADLLKQTDRIAAALRAEQAVGEEQIARELLAEEYEQAEWHHSALAIRSGRIDRAEGIALRAIVRALGTARQSDALKGWRVTPFAGDRTGDERWEIYDENGSGGAIYLSDIGAGVVRSLLDRLAAARQSEGVVFGVTKVDRDFRWDREKMHHVPLLTVEFAPVLPTEGYDAKGWKDRDALATLLAAAPGGEGEG